MSSSQQTNDLRNRILFTLLILAIYRLGTFVPLPGIDPQQLQTLMEGNQKGLLGMFNVFAGGAISRMAIFALGISATIPEKIISDIPFPIPLCVICSPSHIKKTVPATIVVTVEILKNVPGLITKFADDSKPTARP